MNDNRNVNRTGTNTRRIKLAPMTRAVRSVLAASALTLALGATSGTAAAAAHRVPVAHALQLQRAAIDFAKVDDLTQVPGGFEGILPPAGPVMSLIPGGSVVVPGPANVSISGNFTSSGGGDDRMGLYINILNGATVTSNAGSTLYGNATGAGFDGTGIGIYSGAGSVTFNNLGDVVGRATSGNGTGMTVNGYYGVDINNSGNAVGITTAGGTATGISAYSRYDVTIDNSGGVYGEASLGTPVNGGRAYGISAGSYYGDVTITNASTGTIEGYTYSNNAGAGSVAIGVLAQSHDGDVSITNDGSINGEAYWNGLGIGVYAGSVNGNVDIQNSATGTINGYSFSSLGVGIYGNSQYGDVTIGNAGTVTATSINSSGVGIYALGGYGNIDVTNSGDIIATGRTYAAGVTALGHYDVTVTNAVGGYIYGHLTNAGTAVGISATSVNVDPAANSHVGVYNDGDIKIKTAIGSGVGISATATGGSGTADVSNTGNVYVNARAYSATGIVAVGDDGASVTNGGYVKALTPSGNVIGVSAFSTYGDASVDNTGYVAALGNKYGSTGITAGSQYGNVTVSNSGTGFVGASNRDADAIGITATSYAGTVSVSNSDTGEVYATSRYANATGITVFSHDGTASISNNGTGYVHAYSYDGSATGVYAVGFNSDASLVNAGTVYADSYNGNAIGAIVGSYNANVDATNTGTVMAHSSYGSAIGLAAVSNNGTVTVASSGNYGIGAQGYDGAVGIYAHGVGDVTVTNDAAIVVASTGTTGGVAMGIGAMSLADINLSNSTMINVTSASGNAFGMYANASGGGNATVTNSGDISVLATAYGAIADGIFAYGADVTVTNAAGGSIYAGGYNWGTGIEVEATGAASVTNAGEISAVSVYAAYGVYATGDSVTVTNSGSIGGTALSAGSYNNAGVVALFGNATGIMAQGYSSVSVTNAATGVINVYGYYGATGISATVANPGAAVTVSNAGAITAYAYAGYATGIEATAAGPGGTAGVTNSGDISAVSHNKYNAYGVNVFADGNASVTNAAGASIYTYSYGSAYGALATSFAGNATITNAGDIDVVSMGALQKYSYGALANAVNGAATVTNTGAISVHSKYYSTGIMASGLTGATVTNSATGNVVADGWKATGIYAVSANGDVLVSNAGDVLATYTYAPAAAKSAYGIKAVSTNGDVYVANTATGSIDAALLYGGLAVGVFGYSVNGDAKIANAGHIGAGTIDSLAYPAAAVGAAAFTGAGGDATIVNTVSGDISAITVYGNAFGARTSADAGDAAVVNAGDVSGTSVYGAAYGALSESAAGSALVYNSGTMAANGFAAYGAISAGYTSATVQNTNTLTATGDVFAVAGLAIASDTDSAALVWNSGDLYAHVTNGVAGVAIGAASRNTSDGTAMVVNTATGTINATGGMSATGVYAYSNLGDVTVTNAGKIYATAYGAGMAVGVHLDAVNGTGMLNNAAGGVVMSHYTISNPTSYAVIGSAGVDIVNNAGTVNGAVLTYAGNDQFNNLAGGMWDVTGSYSTDFGDDNDSVSNSGTVQLINASIGFGTGNDTFTNNANGLINLSNGLIHMDAGTNTFTNAGKINVFGHVGNMIDAGAAGTVLNNGLIEMNTGFTNEALTVASTFGGVGHLSIDVKQVGGTADHLFVNGNVLATTKQTVDINLAPLFPMTAHTSIPFAWVTGTSAAGNFVPGTIYGYNLPLNFIDLGYTIGSNINTANTASDVFSINLDVNGLNDTGAIAALTAQGAANFMNTQMGTFRQRLGVNPYGDAGKVMSAYVRYYSQNGDVTPGHAAYNFGQGGHFNFHQSSWGYEVGVNANLISNFHAGFVLGNADSNQRLNDGGVGTNRMDGMTFGMYMTWYVPGGWYVDFTARKMAADVKSISVAGTLANRIHTNAWSLEGGYEFKVGNINIVPQIQYTWTQVDELDAPFHGQLVDLNLGNGHYNRGRIGVDFNTQIESGDIRWTPYGSLSWVHNTRGTSTYTISNSYSSFAGETWVNGSAFMAEFGVGMEMGRWGVTLGGSWTDGGSFDSMLGGQATVRYSW